MIREKIITGIVLFTALLFSGANNAESAWTLTMTFNKNGHQVSLWETTHKDRKGFKYYRVHNESNIKICVVPRVWTNRHARSGLKMFNLIGGGTTYELGFVTHKTGHEPQSAKWTVTLYLLENDCSMSHPFPPRIPIDPYRRVPRSGYQSTP